MAPPSSPLARAMGRAPLQPDPTAGTSWWQDRWASPGYAPIDRDGTADIVVVGAGVTGSSVAWHLARAGAHVKLLDARTVASGASGRNGGFLLAGLAHRFEALCELVGTARAADLYRWTESARDRLYAVAAEVGAPDCALRTGSLRLAMDDVEVDVLVREADLLEAAGVEVERLSASDLPPHLARHVLAGLRFPGDGRSIPAGWVRALASSAVEHGAEVHEHSPVAAVRSRPGGGVDVETVGGRTLCARAAVVATEAWLPGLLPELDGHVLPYRSQVLAAAAPRARSGGLLRVLDHPTWSRRGWDYAQQLATGELVVGGEEVEDLATVRTWDETVHEPDQRWLESWCRRVLEVEPDVLSRWAGVLSQSADGFPIVGELPTRPGVWVGGGWGGAGNVLGFACGGRLAELVQGHPGGVPPEFSPGRLGLSAVPS